MKKTLLPLPLRYFLILVFLSGPLGLAAQSPGTPAVFTLEESLRIAEERNLDIKSAEVNLQSAGAAVTSAFGTFLPGADFRFGYERQLSGEGRIRLVQDKIITSFDLYQMSATANLTLFNGFAREANYNSAKETFAATDNTIQHTRNLVLSTVRNQYLMVLRNEQVVNIRREDLALAQKELERISAQYEVGRLAIVNVYAQEAEVGNKELAITQAENDFNISKSDLLTTLGLNPGQQAEFRSTNIPDTITIADIAAFRSRVGSYEQAVAAALENRYDYRAANNRIEAADDKVTVARGGYFPLITASGGWGWSNFELSEFDRGQSYVNLSLSVPIFDNFQTNYQLQTAKVEYQQRDIEKQQLTQTIAADVRKAYLNLDAAEKQLDITQRSLKSAEQNFNSASERFRVGATDILDYTTANAQFVNARINRATAVYNYISAQYQLQYAIGSLDR